MGGSWSSLFSTGGNLETKTIINTLLKRLIGQVDLRDMYSLADPRLCKQYIVVASAALEKLFVRIKISKDKDGVLMFQSMKGLMDSNPIPEEQAKRCNELAFFFIRMFQIYAAIALSIMDSELPVSDPTEIVSSRNKTRRGSVFIKPNVGIAGVPQPKKAFWQRGGALPQNGNGGFYLQPAAASVYARIFNTFLVQPGDPETPENLTFDGYYHNISISQDSLYDTAAQAAAVAAADDAVQMAVAARTALAAGDPGIAAADAAVTDARTRRAAVPRRITKNLGANPPTIFYLIASKTLQCTLAMRQEGAGIKATLTRLKLGEQTSDNQVEKQLAADGSRDGKLFNAVLKDMLDEAYNMIIPFSAIDFLKNKSLVSNGKIINTNIGVVEKGGNKVALRYVNKFKFDEREENIVISLDLRIEKRDKIVNKPYTYVFKADFNTIESNKKEYLYIKDYKHEGMTETFRGKIKEFQTGESDTSTPTSTKDGVSVSAFLTSMFDAMLKPKEEGYSKNAKIDYTREGLPKPLDSESIPPEMRIKKTWEALAKDPPIKAHAIARAMQLLSAAAIRGETKEGISSVCRIKFPYVKDGSLPTAGQPITGEQGIHALAMLFVDKLVGGVPQITEASKFQDFRKRFKFYFERLEKAEGVEAPGKFSDIKEQLPQELCKDHTTDVIQVKGDTLNQLKSKAKQLIQRQATHVRNSMIILFKLFDEQTVRAGGFAISSNVEQGGMDALNSIAQEARNMLVEYYGDCERIYKDGLFILNSKHMAAPTETVYVSKDSGVAAAAAAAPAAAPAPVAVAAAPAP